MSIQGFAKIVESAGLSASDATWFPRWLERYARWTSQLKASRIDVQTEPPIQLLRQMRDAGKKAFVRLQVVRALELYQTRVLSVAVPDLSPIRIKLEEIVARESSSYVFQPPTSSTVDSARVEVTDDEMLVGKIDASEPPLLQEMRKLMRTRHYAARTERSYTGWACRFAAFTGGWEKIAAASEMDVKEFLSDLAVKDRVAASTQNQALAA